LITTVFQKRHHHKQKIILKKIIYVLLLTYSLWGSIVAVSIISLIKEISESQEIKLDFSWLLIVHLGLLIFSGYPIYQWYRNKSKKIIILIIHYLISAFLAFSILFIGLVQIYGWNN